MNKKKSGYLLTICGSMFSGKTEELIRIASRKKIIAPEAIVVFKHVRDSKDRFGSQKKINEHIISRNGSSLSCVSVATANDIKKHIKDKNIDTIIIDEVQFFDEKDIVPFVCDLIKKGIYVVCAGLDLDFKKVPFGPMGTLLAMSDKIIKLTAICSVCLQDRYCLSQRLVNGKPAECNEPVIDTSSSYEPRCRSCHVIK